MSRQLKGQLRIAIAVILLILVAFLTNQYVIFLAFAVTVVFLLQAGSDKSIGLLLFLLPFSTIMKYNPTSMSLFTVCEAIYILKMVYSHHCLPRGKGSVALLAYFAYLFAISLCNGTNTIISVIGMMIPLVVALYATSEYTKADYKEYYLMFSYGVVASNICGLLSSYGIIPRMKQFATAVFDTKAIVDMDGFGASGVQRFYGLFGDCNILALYTICAMGCLTVLFLNRKIGVAAWTVPIVVLLVTGLLTISKTFLILVLILFALVLVTTVIRGNMKLFAKILAGIVGGILLGLLIMMVFDLSPIVTRYIARLSVTRNSSGNVVVSTLTTGRSIIWERYFDSFFNSLRCIVGFGVNGGMTTRIASHNTLIQSLYINGFVGEGLFIYLLLMWKKSVDYRYANIMSSNENHFNFVLPFIVLINLCSLDTFTWDFFPIIISLILIAGKEMEEDNERTYYATNSYV